MCVEVIKEGDYTKKDTATSVFPKRLAAMEVFRWLKMFRLCCYLTIGAFVLLFVLISLGIGDRISMLVGLLGISLPAFFLNTIQKEMVKLKERYNVP